MPGQSAANFKSQQDWYLGFHGTELSNHQSVQIMQISDVRPLQQNREDQRSNFIEREQVVTSGSKAQTKWKLPQMMK